MKCRCDRIASSIVIKITGGKVERFGRLKRGRAHFRVNDVVAAAGSLMLIATPGWLMRFICSVKILKLFFMFMLWHSGLSPPVSVFFMKPIVLFFYSCRCLDCTLYNWHWGLYYCHCHTFRKWGVLAREKWHKYLVIIWDEAYLSSVSGTYSGSLELWSLIACKILTEESDKILIEAGVALLIWTCEISPQNTP